ncbi:MAG: hypothetical protein JO265_10970, partial [Acidimicrobiia bacterium]|nr:hypothetical protein [Acidimicrobiia bacterium]
VPACVSPLHAYAADYVPASTSSPSTVLASTGGTAAMGIAFALLAAGLILRETFKGVPSSRERHGART